MDSPRGDARLSRRVEHRLEAPASPRLGRVTATSDLIARSAGTAVRPRRLTVVGCGYLGSVQAAAMAVIGHDVVGFDVDADKVARLA